LLNFCEILHNTGKRMAVRHYTHNKNPYIKTYLCANK
jgi:hypothetical protein